MKTNGFFQLEIIINVLVSSFCFVWIRTWHGSTVIMNLLLFFCKYFTLTVLGSNLDVGIWHLQTSDSEVWSQSPHWKGWWWLQWYGRSGCHGWCYWYNVVRKDVWNKINNKDNIWQYLAAPSYKYSVFIYSTWCDGFRNLNIRSIPITNVQINSS